jgi:hypothetical protein
MLSVLGHRHHKPEQDLPLVTYISGFVLLVFALLLVPWVLRNYAYTTEGRIRGYGWLAVANVGGALLLAGAVQSGVTVYDWSTSIGS